MQTPTVEHLYRDHHSWLYGWLKHRLQQDSLAADLAHDTFVKILQHQERYSLEQPRALLTTIAKNLSYRWWHRKQIEEAYLQQLQFIAPQYYPSPEQELQAIQLLVELYMLMDQLQQREQQVFIKWQIDGLCYAEIAEQLGVSLITVKRDMKKVMLCCLKLFELDD
ncbi:sigma-70 family RNA polymerase sigma factor [Acinetobacter larvae]|uniref:RNA polymerase subunit sigma n=1 Tax=Acinetobacter larvae TaxID=1789224 RepID=A0A1B2LVQ7_9GAMM|nr:sigma-70 family RNA polymerase sigma factor [Acinetobacter larvae]AOA57031.1 hypothetical protein BFG52_00770 [Acinetobacter larvae]